MPVDNEDNLWHRFKVEGDLDAREALILKYTGLVKYVINRLGINPPSTVDFGDLYNCGIAGLITAVDRFNPELGNKFQTYGICRIRGEILDESKRVGWIPRPLYKKYGEVERVNAELEAQLGRTPRTEEIANALEMDLDELNRILSDYRQASISSLYDVVRENNEDGKVYLVDILSDPDVDVTAPAEAEELSQLVAQMIDQLPDKEKLVVELYYQKELTLKEIGKIMEVSESRVSQVHSQAMLRIRGRLKLLLE
ncbi:MAG: FliA/WhiG family RNA polymerase sigma factor [Candidatus Poribacteria bacterium]|jgi:RNA polymerase sigma factor for flagellar operon FliA|nr:FliA/WhiG family RNA polymerase sigma factor [Candidatus Poribacteria bacterium]MDP6960499.1 FliA/WhiG family RNA polymerase sigma factor [Dehalococcoidia bacterium]